MLLKLFKSGWVSSREKFIEKLESSFAKYADVKYGVAISNGTIALHLALVALKIGPNDEVILPDLTFAATINL
jgi:perosamine synthetase